MTTFQTAIVSNSCFRVHLRLPSSIRQFRDAPPYQNANVASRKYDVPSDEFVQPAEFKTSIEREQPQVDESKEGVRRCRRKSEPSKERHVICVDNFLHLDSHERRVFENSCPQSPVVGNEGLKVLACFRVCSNIDFVLISCFKTA